MTRVAITGIGIVSPLGIGYPALMEGLLSHQSGISSHTDWHDQGIQTGVAGVVKGFDESHIPRKIRRSMSRVGQFAYVAASEAFANAKMNEELIQSPDTGIAFGSTMGGTSAISEYYEGIVSERKLDAIKSTTFLKIMSHTCAANLGIAFKIPGRIVASCTACAAATQALGFGYEAIKAGSLKRAICGGAEELHVSVAAVFDVMRSTSTKYNSTPQSTPRPFDEGRDGIAVAEGAGAILLEDMDEAIGRGAPILGEILGFATNNDAQHMTNPSVEGLRSCMNLALKNAKVPPTMIDYVNCHGTGTDIGDEVESKAIHSIFGSQIPVSSLKGHLGHMMGSCGAVELAATLGMMKEKKIFPTLNLNDPSENCAKIDYVMGEHREKPLKTILKNSFAFGGINASIIVSTVA